MPPQAESNSGVYTQTWRIVTGALVGWSRASLPLLLFLLWRANDPPITPPILFRLLLIFSIAPALVAWILARNARARVEADESGLRVVGQRLEIEFPPTAVERVEPWRIPLPGPGLSLRMRSGRLATYRLQIDDPSPLIAALERGMDKPSAAALATDHPMVAWAHARATHGTHSWPGRFGKFVLFALLPAAILFNAHQHISYGGLWGQYYQEGLEPYLLSAGVHWATVSVYLVLYASALRGAAEAVALAVTSAAPSSAASARRAAERCCTAAYYLGVPLTLALRFRS